MKPSASPQPRRAAAAAFIGTMIEWYDFYIYATAAALVFGALFFPSDDSLFSTMAAFGTFAVGFFARPLGGVIFGHYGDRIGRKRTPADSTIAWWMVRPWSRSSAACVRANWPCRACLACGAAMCWPSLKLKCAKGLSSPPKCSGADKCRASCGPRRVGHLDALGPSISLGAMI